MPSTPARGRRCPPQTLRLLAYSRSGGSKRGKRPKPSSGRLLRWLPTSLNSMSCLSDGPSSGTGDRTRTGSRGLWANSELRAASSTKLLETNCPAGTRPPARPSCRAGTTISHSAASRRWRQVGLSFARKRRGLRSFSPVLLQVSSSPQTLLAPSRLRFVLTCSIPPRQDAPAGRAAKSSSSIALRTGSRRRAKGATGKRSCAGSRGAADGLAGFATAGSVKGEHELSRPTMSNMCEWMRLKSKASSPVTLVRGRASVSAHVSLYPIEILRGHDEEILVDQLFEAG